MRTHMLLAFLTGLMAFGFLGPARAGEPATIDENEKDSFVVTGRLVDQSGRPITNQTVEVIPLYKRDGGYDLIVEFDQGRKVNPSERTDAMGKFQITVPLDFVSLGANFTLGIYPRGRVVPLTKDGILLNLSLSEDDTLRRVHLEDIVVERE